MITDTDVKKLVKEFRKVFPTKEDLKNELKNYATKEDLKRFATKEDLKSELSKYATKKDIEEITESIITELAEDIGDVMIEVKETNHELQTHRIILGNLQARMEKLEKKKLVS